MVTNLPILFIVTKFLQSVLEHHPHRTRGSSHSSSSMNGGTAFNLRSCRDGQSGSTILLSCLQCFLPLLPSFLPSLSLNIISERRASIKSRCWQSSCSRITASCPRRCGSWGAAAREDAVSPSMVIQLSFCSWIVQANGSSLCSLRCRRGSSSDGGGCRSGKEAKMATRRRGSEMGIRSKCSNVFSKKN